MNTPPFNPDKNDIKDPFLVPEGYFGSLENQLMNKVSGKAKIRRLIPRLLAAASVILIGGLSWLLISNDQKGDVAKGFDDIPNEEIASYINEIDISEQDLIQVLSMEDLENIYESVVLKNEGTESEEVFESDTLSDRFEIYPGEEFEL
jgi:hypothetical protein